MRRKETKDNCDICICNYCNTKDCIKKTWCEIKPCNRSGPDCTGHGQSDITSRFETMRKIYKMQRSKRNESKYTNR